MTATVDLVHRAQAGDTDAFGQLYRAYRADVHRFVLSKVHDWDVADDLTQETFTRALRAVGQWQWQGKDPGAWLTTIARNAVASHFRRAEYRHTVVVADYPADVTDSSREGDPEKAVITGLRDAALRNALRQLTPARRRALVHRYFDGMSVQDVAAAMGRSESAVKANAFQGLRALRRGLAIGAGR